MAAERIELQSCTIPGGGIRGVVRPGDSVLIRPREADRLPHVAQVEKIEADHGNNIKVHVQWFYRPEECPEGRQIFNGVKELFLSNHFGIQSVGNIKGKCFVHTFQDYCRLEKHGANDFFCRFEYDTVNGVHAPDHVPITLYCFCEMPYNPDEFMLYCEGCHDWYHPSCVAMSIREAKELGHYICSLCLPHDDIEVSSPLNPASPSDE